MDRDEFITRAVEALEQLGCSVFGEEKSATNTTARYNDGMITNGDQSVSDIYEKLLYDYPDVNEMELRACIRFVASWNVGTGMRDGDATVSTSSLLLREIFGRDIGETNTTEEHRRMIGQQKEPSRRREDAELDQMLRRKAVTLVENMQRGAQSSGLWQELYGLHVFALLSHGHGGSRRHNGMEILSYEDVVGEKGCNVQDVLLDDAAAWESGRLAMAWKECVTYMCDSFSYDKRKEDLVEDLETRMNVLFDLMMYSAVQSMNDGHASVVNAMYDMMLDWSAGAKNRSKTSVRCMAVITRQISRMTASLIMECRTQLILNHDHVLRILTEIVGPEVDGLRGKQSADTVLLIMAAAVCIEYLVRYSITRNVRLKSWIDRFESDMIRCGIYNACIQGFISLTKDIEHSASTTGDICTLSKSLVLVGCFSDRLRAWCLRVPGYVDAWGRYIESGKASPVVTTTWMVLSSMPENATDGHIRILQEIFCTESPKRDGERFLPSQNESIVCTANEAVDSLDAEQLWVSQLVSHIATLGLVSLALRHEAPVGNCGQEQVIARIEEERKVLHQRLSRLQSRQDDALSLYREDDKNLEKEIQSETFHLQDDDRKKKEHRLHNHPSLLLIKSYRDCDRSLKSLSSALQGSKYAVTTTKYE